jgi:hypothetical protein
MKDEYEFVDWDADSKVHNWRIYININVRQIWHTFTREQKIALVKNADALADTEEWD